MLEMSLKQKQSDLVSVHVYDLHFACNPVIRSPQGTWQPWSKGDMVTSVCAGLSTARLPAQSRSAWSSGEYTSGCTHFGLNTHRNPPQPHNEVTWTEAHFPNLHGGFEAWAASAFLM